MEIRELSSDLKKDWFDFFDQRAFGDHREWSTCYCTAFYYPKAEDYPHPSKRKRDYAEWLIDTGQMAGYLVYAKGRAVAWVNCNDRSRYHGLAGIHDGKEKVLSIVCFIVEKEYRGRGIATGLLERILADAKGRGYAVVEAYPKKKARSEFGTWNGPYAMYIKAGFEDFETGGKKVVRKIL